MSDDRRRAAEALRALAAQIERDPWLRVRGEIVAERDVPVAPYGFPTGATSLETAAATIRLDLRDDQ